MKKTVALVTLLLSVAACTQKAKPPASMTPAEVMGLLQNDFAVLIDVRPADVAGGGKAQPARNIPAAELDAEKISQTISKEKQVVFYGAGRDEAIQAANRLAEKGYKTGYLEGYDAWVSAGLPISP